MEGSVTVTIGEVTRPLDEAGNDWINSQIVGRQKEGHVCVRVRITGPGVDLLLSTGACAKGGGGGGRQANPKESEILAAWSAKELDDVDFKHGRLISFLNSLR